MCKLLLAMERRDALVVANEIATLDIVSDGRSVFGIGAGHTPSVWTMRGVAYPTLGGRVDRLAELVEIVPRLLRGETVTCAGDHIRCDAAVLDGEVAAAQSNIPMLIGGNGTRVLERARAHADVVGFTGAGAALADGHNITALVGDGRYCCAPMPTLSEAESKRLLAQHGVPLLDERIVADPAAAVAAATEMGFPVVAKLNGHKIAHKTERGLVKLNLRDAGAVEEAAQQLLAAAVPEDGDVQVLIAPMLKGNRELIAGLMYDDQFGPTIMLGIGGILAEAIQDVVFRLVPITEIDAQEMIEELKTQRLLDEFRGEPAVDRDALTQVLLGLSKLADSNPLIRSVDVNPLIVSPVDGRPLAVDALVEVSA